MTTTIEADDNSEQLNELMSIIEKIALEMVPVAKHEALRTELDKFYNIIKELRRTK